MNARRLFARLVALRPLLCACVAALALTACGSPRALRVDDMIQVRTYVFDGLYPDPEAIWHPSDHRILARAPGGFSLLAEGRGQQQSFASPAHGEVRHPAWLGPDRFVSGTRSNVTRDAEGRILASSEGMTVVTLLPDQAIAARAFATVGYRPRSAPGFGKQPLRLFVQNEDRILALDPQTGAGSEYDRGFFAEPEPHGLGVAFQETPIIERDHWTGIAPTASRLIVRWKPGSVDFVHGGLAPRWVAGGGLVCTVLTDSPTTTAGATATAATAYAVNIRQGRGIETAVALLPGPGQPARILLRDAHQPAPHPQAPIIAVALRGGGISLIDHQGRGRPLCDVGEAPQWSADGTRLMVLEPRQRAGEAQSSDIRIYVFAPRQ